MIHRHMNGGYIIVLSRGEAVFDCLVSFCSTRGIRAASFHGIGAVEDVSIGYYDLEKKAYFFREEKGLFEVASMTGNVTFVDGEPFIHAHAVLSRADESCAAIGGHLKHARAAVTLEIVLTPFDGSLERKMDDAIGLKLISL